METITIGISFSMTHREAALDCISKAFSKKIVPKQVVASPNGEVCVVEIRWKRLDFFEALEDNLPIVMDLAKNLRKVRKQEWIHIDIFVGVQLMDDEVGISIREKALENMLKFPVDWHFQIK